MLCGGAPREASARRPTRSLRNVASPAGLPWNAVLDSLVLHCSASVARRTVAQSCVAGRASDGSVCKQCAEPAADLSIL